MEITPEFEAAIRKLGAACIGAGNVSEIVGGLSEEVSADDNVIVLVEIIESLGVASCDLLQVFWSERGGAAENEEVEALSKIINI